MSFSAWALPAEIRKGFVDQEPLTVEAVSLLVLWYGLITVAAYVGFRFGKQVRPAGILNNNNDALLYLMVSVLADFGIVASLLFSVGLQEVIDALTSLQANYIKYALYDNYIIGLNTLRYLTIISGTIGCYKIIVEKKYNLLHFINIICLLFSALISHRLSLIVAAFLFLGLIYKNKPKINFVKLSILGIAFLSLMLFYNVTRNYLFYIYIGIESPFEMLITEVITYVGSPFQVSVGVANNFQKFPNDFYMFIDSILPSYVHSIFGATEWEVFQESYRGFIDVDSTLITNSAFCNLYVLGGWYSYLFIASSSFIFALLAGHFINYDNYVSLVAFVIFYCFSELWRVYMFNTGIIHALLLTLIILGLISGKVKTPGRAN